jgi:hypothetical protein
VKKHLQDPESKEQHTSADHWFGKWWTARFPMHVDDNYEHWYGSEASRTARYEKYGVVVRETASLQLVVSSAPVRYALQQLQVDDIVALDVAAYTYPYQLAQVTDVIQTNFRNPNQYTFKYKLWDRLASGAADFKRWAARVQRLHCHEQYLSSRQQASSSNTATAVPATSTASAVPATSTASAVPATSTASAVPTTGNDCSDDDTPLSELLASSSHSRRQSKRRRTAQDSDRSSSAGHVSTSSATAAAAAELTDGSELSDEDKVKLTPQECSKWRWRATGAAEQITDMSFVLAAMSADKAIVAHNAGSAAGIVRNGGRVSAAFERAIVASIAGKDESELVVQNVQEDMQISDEQIDE